MSIISLTVFVVHVHECVCFMSNVREIFVSISRPCVPNNFSASNLANSYLYAQPTLGYKQTKR